MIKAGILNVTGYGGAELVRVISNHPEAEVAGVTGRSQAGKRVREVFPHLAECDLQIAEQLEGGLDVVFSALPHGTSAEKLLPHIERGVRCIDLSADFRLKDPATYARWYRVQHPAPQLLERAVYGVPELHRERIAAAPIVANPGCFCVGAILGIAPLAKAGLAGGPLVNDSKTGVSGAGRTADAAYGFSELTENVRTYAIGGHRHQPEMVQELTALAGGELPALTFVPHLVPMARGIVGTSYIPLKGGIDAAELRRIYTSMYADEPFVRVADAPPEAKSVRGSNTVRIHPHLANERLAVITTALDNLVKGAAGIAVQNMNLMFGLDERQGLAPLTPLAP